MSEIDFIPGLNFIERPDDDPQVQQQPERPSRARELAERHHANLYGTPIVDKIPPSDSRARKIADDYHARVWGDDPQKPAPPSDSRARQMTNRYMRDHYGTPKQGDK